MTKRTILTGVLALMLGLLLPMLLSAQQSIVTIPVGSEITIPAGATLCADVFYANNPGYGVLTYPDANSICRASVIPVELVRFSAELRDGIVLLIWTTAAEMQNLGFEVQRTTGHGAWTPLGFVEGHGTTTKAHSYSMTDLLRDIPAETSVLHYRLKQIDLDGRYEYSPEVEVRLDGRLPRLALEGFPSPCDDQLTIRLTVAGEGVTSIRLHDIAGRVVMIISQDAVLPAGSHSMMVRTAGVPSGLYLLVVDGSEGRRTEKVVIRH
jgi:hypothetical protein